MRTHNVTIDYEQRSFWMHLYELIGDFDVTRKLLSGLVYLKTSCYNKIVGRLRLFEHVKPDEMQSKMYRGYTCLRLKMPY